MAHCDICKKGFKTLEALTQHNKDKNHKCLKCNDFKSSLYHTYFCSEGKYHKSCIVCSSDLIYSRSSAPCWCLPRLERCNNCEDSVTEYLIKCTNKECGKIYVKCTRP